MKPAKKYPIGRKLQWQFHRRKTTYGFQPNGRRIQQEQEKCLLDLDENFEVRGATTANWRKAATSTRCTHDIPDHQTRNQQYILSSTTSNGIRTIMNDGHDGTLSGTRPKREHKTDSSLSTRRTFYKRALNPDMNEEISTTIVPITLKESSSKGDVVMNFEVTGESDIREPHRREIRYWEGAVE